MENWAIMFLGGFLGIALIFMIRHGLELLGYWLEIRERKKVWRAIQKKHMDLLRRKR